MPAITGNRPPVSSTAAFTRCRNSAKSSEKNSPVPPHTKSAAGLPSTIHPTCSRKRARSISRLSVKGVTGKENSPHSRALSSSGVTIIRYLCSGVTFRIPGLRCARSQSGNKLRQSLASCLCFGGCFPQVQHVYGESCHVVGLEFQVTRASADPQPNAFQRLAGFCDLIPLDHGILCYTHYVDPHAHFSATVENAVSFQTVSIR